MQKGLSSSELYFRTELYKEEQLLSAGDFAALNIYVLGGLKQDARIFTSAVRLPRTNYIEEPQEQKQVIFQLTDFPRKKQREVAGILLRKFPYLKPDFFMNIMSKPQSYIELFYTKYSQGYKVCISLVRLTDIIAKNQQQEAQEEKLAENRRTERKQSITPKIRLLRAKPRKQWRDHLILDLAERGKI